jgi:adenylosuccinate lyase
VDTLVVYPERMRRNVDLTKGLVFSSPLLQDLVAAGMLREKAYALVQSNAMRAWEEDGDFRAMMEADPEVRAFLTADRIAAAFSVERQLRNVDKIFARVFGREASA